MKRMMTGGIPSLALTASLLAIALSSCNSAPIETAEPQVSSAPQTTAEPAASPSIPNSPLVQASSPAASAAPEAIAQSDSNLPEVFQSILPQLKQSTQIPILLPSELPAEVTQDPLYATSTGATDRYTITLGLVPDCNANACSIGELSAERGGTPYPDEFSQRVTLAQGIEGYYQPLSCGASCSPPVLAWSDQGIFYRMYLQVGGSDEVALQKLVELANSAIEAGAR